MDWQQAFTYLLGLAIAGISWFIRGMLSDQKALQSEIATHRLHVSENYTKKSEIDAMRRDMNDQFTRLHERLDELVVKK
jgi:ABC-type ATPase involved in cell division